MFELIALLRHNIDDLAIQLAFSWRERWKDSGFVNRESGRFFFFSISQICIVPCPQGLVSYVECHWGNSRPRRFYARGGVFVSLDFY